MENIKENHQKKIVVFFKINKIERPLIIKKKRTREDTNYKYEK